MVIGYWDIFQQAVGLPDFVLSVGINSRSFVDTIAMYSFSNKGEGQMTRLTCNVGNCGNNEHGFCCVGSIEIGGKNALESAGTCCSSYIDKQGAHNLTTHPNPQVEIHCKAQNCVHNCDGACDASQINVGNASACCCEQTECCEFCCK